MRRRKVHYSVFTQQDGTKMMRNPSTGVVKPYTSSALKVSKKPRIQSKFKNNWNPSFRNKYNNSNIKTMNGTLVKNNNNGAMMESIDKLNLLDFTRKSYENYYNQYYDDNLGTPKVNRIKIKGFRFFDDFNNQIARVEVEAKNENNIITIFEINKEYQGHGFAKDLLRMAEVSLSANAAKFDISETSKINFFEANGFIKIGMKKQTCILKLDTRSKPVDRAKAVEYFDKPSIATSIDRDLNNELYHTGGYDYEGYRAYL